MADEQESGNVFIGHGAFPRGSGNVVIRPAPGGDVRVSGGVAIGHGAEADESSVAIGHQARITRLPAPAGRWDSPWTVALVAGTLTAVVSGALLALLHLG
jgi:hypothetical protein